VVDYRTRYDPICCDGQINKAVWDSFLAKRQDRWLRRSFSQGLRVFWCQVTKIPGQFRSLPQTKAASSPGTAAQASYRTAATSTASGHSCFGRLFRQLKRWSQVLARCGQGESAGDSQERSSQRA
jgi:hypothetical protein